MQKFILNVQWCDVLLCIIVKYYKLVRTILIIIWNDYNDAEFVRELSIHLKTCLIDLFNYIYWHGVLYILIRNDSYDADIQIEMRGHLMSFLIDLFNHNYCHGVHYILIWNGYNDAEMHFEMSNHLMSCIIDSFSPIRKDLYDAVFHLIWSIMWCPI